MSAKYKASFPYTRFKIRPFPSSKRSLLLLRPIIPVIILYQSKLVKFEALIDSGADYNVFHGDIAAYLGIKLTSGSKRQITGISGSLIKGYQHIVNLQIESYQYSAPIIFSNQIPNNALAVLGNQGFFDHFSVTFNFKARIITVAR